MTEHIGDMTLVDAGEAEGRITALKAALAQVVAVGHDNDCIFCGFKDRVVDAALTAPPLAELVARGNLESVLRDVVAWGVQTFPTSTDKSKTAHLIKEARELDANPCAEEMADVLMILAHLAAAKGVNLADAVREKLATCKERVWAEPDTEGVVEHVREDSAIVARREALEKAADMLAMILPMAKGHAYQHRVGANMKKIQEAEAAVAALRDKIGPEISGNSL